MTKVLVGRRTEQHEVDPNVISTPTRKVLLELARVWVEPVRSGELSREDLPLVRPTVSYVVEELFARKLGMGDALETGEVEFRIERMTAVQATRTSVVGHDEELVERLTMFNAQVALTKGHDLCASRTEAYDPLLWPTVDQYPKC